MDIDELPRIVAADLYDLDLRRQGIGSALMREHIQ